MKSLIIAMLMPTAAFAGITDHQYDTLVSKESVTIIPKKGFHLNQDAPASAVIDTNESMQKPAVKKEAIFVFVTRAGDKKAVLSFYVCDDKKTVCEKHEDSVDLTKITERANQPADINQLKKSDEQKKLPKNSQEQIKSHYDDAKNLSLKSQNGKPTLIVFSAPWCPPCVRMFSEVYDQPEVKKQLAQVNFFKLNSDLPETYELSKQFNVKAIPTLVLLDQEGNEAYRWLDYQPAQGFANSIKAEVRKVGEAKNLLAKAQAGDQNAAHLLGMRAYNTLSFAEAIKWLSMTKNESDQKYKLASEVSLAELNLNDEEKPNTEYLAALEKGIVLTTSKIDQLRWTIDYLEKKHEIKAFNGDLQTKALTLVKEIDALSKNPKKLQKEFLDSTYGEYGGFEIAELFYQKSRIYKMLDLKNELQANNEKAIAHLNKIKISVQKPGIMLNVIGYLREAGETKNVEAMYKKLIEAYPNTYVYFEKYARFEQKQGHLNEALKLTESAIQYPAGNLPQLHLLKAQLLVGLNRKPEAVSLIDETLKADYSQHERYKGVVKKLTALKEQTAVKQ